MSLVTRQLKKWRHKTAPDPAFKDALWYELDAAFVRLYPSSLGLRWRRFVLYPAAAAALVMTMGTGTYAYASPSVTNKSVLYPVKRGIESIEVRFHGNPEGLAAFHVRMMDRRLQEGETLLEGEEVDSSSLREIGEEMHLSVSQVAQIRAAQEQRERLLTRLQLERERYEYLLNRANEIQRQRLVEHDEKLRNTIEQIRVRVNASELSEEEKGTLLLHFRSDSESEIHSND